MRIELSSTPFSALSSLRKKPHFHFMARVFHFICVIKKYFGMENKKKTEKLFAFDDKEFTLHRRRNKIVECNQRMRQLFITKFVYKKTKQKKKSF